MMIILMIINRIYGMCVDECGLTIKVGGIESERDEREEKSDRSDRDM